MTGTAKSIDPSGGHYFQQRYLFGFATMAEILEHLRVNADPGEMERATEIVEQWQGLQPQLAQLMQQEAGYAEGIKTTPVPPEFDSVLQSFAADPAFQSTFSGLPFTFETVEVDRLVASQRSVNLDYVGQLMASFGGPPSFRELVDICLSPVRSTDPIRHLEVAPDVHVFSSRNNDVRYLGSSVKKPTADDLNYAVRGGLPLLAVVSFIGYGGAPVNAFRAGGRVVLNNGFHRVYALRSLGVREVPMVIQHVSNVDLEFPPVVVELPRDYVLGAPRPVLIKDFFEAGFALSLRIRERMKMISLAVDLTQHDVPL